MINSYQEGWLENDSSKIIKLFSDSAILIPSGLMPINGKEEIIKFWWPNDGSITKINDYKIILIEIAGTSDMAYTYENGKLSWSYQKENFSISKTQESFELTVFRKSEGRWRIMKRIWTDIKR
jgi:ketosteroid isomerase-like protein